MFEKNDKRRIYWLINQFLAYKMTPTKFCDEYYYCYDLEVDKKTLSDVEHAFFSELSNTASRFSEYPEDHKNTPGVYITEPELRKTAREVFGKLKPNGKKNKQKIYEIIDGYLSNKLTAKDFCDAYLTCLGFEIDPNDLTPTEDQAFLELGNLAVEFAKFDENYNKYHDDFYTEKTLRNKVIKTKASLELPATL